MKEIEFRLYDDRIEEYSKGTDEVYTTWYIANFNKNPLLNIAQLFQQINHDKWLGFNVEVVNHSSEPNRFYEKIGM